MITIDQVRTAQRNAPNAEETKQLQKDYEAQRRAARAEKQAARNREQHAEDTRIAREAETCAARDTEDVAGVYHDFATRGNCHEALTYKRVRVRGRIALVSGGELVGWTNDNKTYEVVVVDARMGAHWSDQPSGRSGWHVIHTVRLPEELRTVKMIDLV